MLSICFAYLSSSSAAGLKRSNVENKIDINSNHSRSFQQFVHNNVYFIERNAFKKRNAYFSVKSLPT